MLYSRAELDRQIAREGLLPAVAAWTPVEAVRRAGASRWPEATFSRYEWRGEGNFFTRSLRRWHAERRPPADPIAADRRLGREAMGEFIASPMRHLVATVAVEIAVPVALFLFHALLTEFLPRFAVPALPLAWGAVTLALCGAHRDPGR